MTTTNLTATAIDNGLLSPTRIKWTGNTITFSIPGDLYYGSPDYADSRLSKLEPTAGQGYEALTGPQSTQVALAMSIWDSYIAPSMPQVADGAQGTGDIRVAFADLLQQPTTAYAYGYAPGTSAVSGDIWIARENYFQNFVQGTYDFQALLHEIGHALGIKHPFDLPALVPGSGGEDYNKYPYSIMSYTTLDFQEKLDIEPTSIGFLKAVTTDATPMVLDIQAVQDLYGKDTTTHAGNDVYTFTDADFDSRRSIYDAGGTDTLDFSALSRASHIDLRQGAYSDIDYFSLADQLTADVAQLKAAGLTGQNLTNQTNYVRTTLNDTSSPTYQWTNNLGIAFSTTIENVIGTSKSDVIVGNTSGNVITGGGGADSITGGGGLDVFKDTAANLNGDTITDFAGGDYIYITNAVSALPVLAYTDSLLSFALSSAPKTIYKLTVNGATGLVQQRADAAGGIDIYFQPAAPQTSYSIAVQQPNSVNEGNAAPGNTLVYTVTRTDPTGIASVNVAFSGTATGAGKAGGDYTVTGLDASGLLAFAAGAKTATFNVTTIPDKKSEPNETVIATISNPTNGVVGTSTATGTITDDDATAGAPLKALGFAYPMDHLSAGDTLNYSVTFNQAAFVAPGEVADAIESPNQQPGGDFHFTPTGYLPALILSNGNQATYVSGSGTSTLVFSHTVEAGETSADLTPVTISNQGGSGILDADGTETPQTMSAGTFIADGGTTAVSGTGGGSDPVTDPVAANTDQALFGSIVHDVASAAGNIYALYETILGRAPDALGLEAAAAAVDAGTPLKAIARDLLSSSEYTSDYGRFADLPAGDFIQHLYENGLGRMASSTEIQGWEDLLNGGTSRAQVAKDIALSPESQADLPSVFQSGVFVPDQSASSISRLYYGLLDRAPDTAGLASLEARAQHGASLTSIAKSLIHSLEYTGSHGAPGNAAFVNALFEGALGRPADAGAASFVHELNHGATRASVAIGIAESPEAIAHLSAKIENGFHVVA